MSLTPHVQVTVTINNSGVALAGFGLIGILSYTTLFPERLRLYSRTAAMVSDGFAADSPEVLAAGRILSQNPHPPQIAVLRGTHAPTQRYQINASVNNSFPYKVKVRGESVTATTAAYTSDSSATRPEIHNGLVTQLNAVVGKNYTAAFGSLTYADQTFTANAGTDVVTVTAHGLNTGDGPFTVSNSGGGLPGGLAGATNYWFIKIDADTGYLATSLANALAGTRIDLASAGTGTQTISDVPGTTASPSLPIVITASAAGDWFSLEVLDRTAMSNKQTHADPGLATDLTAIATADNSWYYLYTYFNSDDCLEGAAEWVETSGKMAYLDTCNTETENTAVTNGDAWDDVLGESLKRTVPCYHSSPAQMLGAGIMGRLAPLNPGKWTAAYKSVVGVDAMTFTDTQFQNLNNRKVTYYKSEAGRGITWEGKVGNPDYAFADVVTAMDWFTDTLQKRMFGVLIAKNKTGYTDEDITELKGAAEGVVLLGMSDAYTIVAPGTPGSDTDPEPAVSFPRVADIDSATRGERILPDGAISFRFNSAIHKVIFDVTVSF